MSTKVYDLQDFIRVKDNLAACKGPVLIITPPVFAYQVIEPKLRRLFPKKSRVVAAENIKPGNTEIPGDVIIICRGCIPDKVADRLPNHTQGSYLPPGHPKFKRRSPSPEALCFELATIIQYIQVMEQHNWHVWNPPLPKEPPQTNSTGHGLL